MAESGTARKADGAGRGLYPAAGVVALLVVLALAWWLYRPVADLGPIRSIAILPLENLSGDLEQEYFSDGMTEALIASLVRVSPELRVISRTSTMQYKGTHKRIPEIAAELDVAGVIEGSAVREGNRVRITVQLIDARNDAHLWAESYEREFESALALQSEVAREVAGQIHLTLLPERVERLQASPPVDPAALESYMRGMHHLQKLTIPDSLRAIELFEQATRQDPDFAQAHVYVARAYLAYALQLGAMPLGQALPRIRGASERALALDESLALPRALLATVQLQTDWEWEAADASYARALELEPSNTDVHHQYSNFLVSTGRTEEGLALGRRAVRTAPLDLDRRQHLCWLYYMARRYEQALLECEQLAEDHPSFAKPHQYLWGIHHALGEPEAAYSSLHRFAQLAGLDEGLIAASEQGHRESGAPGAYRAVARLIEANGENGAWWWAFAGEYERALLALEQAVADQSVDLMVVPSLHMYDPLHSDPRFQAILRRIDHPLAP